MDMDYKFKNKEIEKFVRNWKVAFFNIVACNQKIMDDLEEGLKQTTDKELIEKLQSLLIERYDAGKSFLASTDSIIESMKQLDVCDMNYQKMLEENNILEKVGEDQSEIKIEEEKVQGVINEVPQENTLISVEAPKEEEVVSEESSINENSSIETSKATSEENQVIPIEENTLISVEAPKEEEVVSEESPINENSSIETSKAASEENQVIPIEVPTSVQEKIPNLESSKITFIEQNPIETKAILVSQNQKNKLRASLDAQKSLVPFIYNKESQESSVTEQTLEEMMKELSSLYSEGKTKEAEEMSERINVLSKKMQTTV